MPMLRSSRAPAAAVTAAGALLLGAALVPDVQAHQQAEAPPTPTGPPRSAAVLFHEAGCEQCHGANLAGTGKGPSLLTVGKVLKKDEIRRQIQDGGGEMPSFAGALQAEEIDRLGIFLATNKKAPKGLPPTPAEKPPTAPPPSPPTSGDSTP